MVNTREQRRDIYDHYKTYPKCVQLSKMLVANLRQGKCWWPARSFMVNLLSWKGSLIGLFCSQRYCILKWIPPKPLWNWTGRFLWKILFRSEICKQKSPKIYQKRQWSSQTVANIGDFLSLLDWRITAFLRKKLYLSMHYRDYQSVLGKLWKHLVSN